MEIFRKDEYCYTIWVGNTSYELTGEWDVEAVARFIKKMEEE